ncbi:TolC family outer membrane protein [Jannaschia ovalis]|uniref:TolC family outer membrane protein n=1 Tax=Jannaschia ovalis TaxID=3038773 RepID=A0ABY8LF26_9RHOB|nr:TolC family outer membrane protein [Jannaschia sp. GRR-S6-38]WGH78930.1 TolC family outer membrane protein [Jannaschia sp. GRR-S6-38]
MAETLTDTLIQAYRSSPLLEQQRFLLRATDEDVAVAVSALRPVISAQAAYSKTNTNVGDVRTTTTTGGSLSLLLDYTLVDGGQRYLRIGAAKEAVLAARYGLLQQEQNVLLDAAEAFLDLRLAVRTVDVRESNQRLLSQQLQAARDRFEVGEVTRTDVALAESRLATARSLLAGARGQVDIAREIYRLAVGELPDAFLAAPPPAPQLPATVDRAQALALQIHPLILAGQHEVTASRLLAEAAEADRLPTINLGANVSYGRPDTLTSGVSITGNVPIYNGGRLSALNRRAIALAQASRAELAQTGRIITDGVGRAWAGLQIAQAQIIATREAVRAAQVAFDGFREEASLGARTTLDVLDAEQDLLDSRVDQLQAESDAQVAVYRVLAAMGLLTTEHLGLSVERYDPTVYYNLVSNAPAISPSQQGGRLDSVLRRFGRN